MGLLSARRERREAFEADLRSQHDTEVIDVLPVTDDTAVMDLPDNTGWTTELLAELQGPPTVAADKPWDQDDEPWPDEDDGGDPAWPRYYQSDPDDGYDTSVSPPDITDVVHPLPRGAVLSGQDVYEGGNRCENCHAPTTCDPCCGNCSGSRKAYAGG